MKQKALCVSDTGSFFFTRHPDPGRACPFPVFLPLRLLFPPSDSKRKPSRNRPSPRGSRPPIPRPLLPPPAPQSHVCASPGLTFFSCLSSPRPPCSALRHAIRSGKLPSAPAVQDATAIIPAVTADEKRTPTPPRLSVFSLSGIRCRCSPDILPRFVYPLRPAARQSPAFLLPPSRPRPPVPLPIETEAPPKHPPLFPAMPRRDSTTF